jgi:hypothetical protein
MSTIPNIFSAQERTVRFYKLTALGLGVLSLVLIAVVCAAAFQNPIVIVKREAGQEFYPSVRKRAPLGKPDVEAFTKNFLVSLYVWNDFKGTEIARAIGPYADLNLAEKVIDAQSQRYVKELKGKHIAQAITFLDIDVQDAKVICRFDRVLKIEGIPLIIPAEVTLTLEQGEPSALNPMGIYVTGILENDNGK